MTFNYKLVSCNLEGKVASFERVIWNKKSADAKAKPSKDMAGNEESPVDTATAKAIKFDFVIGCDGGHSALRQCMMKQMDMDFQQSYIDALWCDFIIPPASDGDHRMSSKNFHVWPQNESIFVAQPGSVSADR